MVNFRFHLVSLTAVFLALAAGITIGAGVVDRATVDQIELRLRDVDDRRKATNEENDRLRSDLGRWGDFGQQLGDQPLAGRLVGTTVLIVGVKGVDRGVVEGLRSSIVAAGATVDGTVWFTGKWGVADEDARELAGVLDASPTTRPEDLRTAGLAGIATAWAIGDSGPLVPALVDRGFLEFEEGSATTVPLAELPRQGSLFVIVSGDGADVPSADLAGPLVARLAGSDIRVLAAQPVPPPPTSPPEGADKEAPAEFVMALRADPSVSNRISSIDNVDDYRGRTAAVLAMGELQAGRTGHYGFGPDARLLPDAGR